MTPILRGLVLVPILLALRPVPAVAGMPLVTLSDIARARIQTISFFLLVFLACALIVQRLWNSLRIDFPGLPRLSYGKATGVVALWGLLFLLVLTMISGARELMTPGAWRKEGYVSRLREAPKAKPEHDQETARRQGLDRLRVALWTYALGHQGRFPTVAGSPEIPEELWRLPDPSGMRYLYRGGQVAGAGADPLAFEPDLFGDGRLMLLTTGAIRRMTREEIQESVETRNP